MRLALFCRLCLQVRAVHSDVAADAHSPEQATKEATSAVVLGECHLPSSLAKLSDVCWLVIHDSLTDVVCCVLSCYFLCLLGRLPECSGRAGLLQKVGSLVEQQTVVVGGDHKCWLHCYRESCCAEQRVPAQPLQPQL